VIAWKNRFVPFFAILPVLFTNLQSGQITKKYLEIYLLSVSDRWDFVKQAVPFILRASPEVRASLL
jgi:hypothetical protein